MSTRLCTIDYVESDLSNEDLSSLHMRFHLIDRIRYFQINHCEILTSTYINLMVLVHAGGVGHVDVVWCILQSLSCLIVPLVIVYVALYLLRMVSKPVLHV